MMSIRLDENIESDVAEIAAKMNKSKSRFIRDAIIEYIENTKDYINALEALKEIDTMKSKGQKTTYSLNEIKEMYKHELQD